MEKFIYQKRASLTKELCDDIIEHFEEDYENKKYMFNINKLDTEYELSYLSNNKIKNHLINELNNNIAEYQTATNIKLFKNHTKYQKSTMIIKKNTMNENPTNETIKIKKRLITFTKKINTFAFIWFLNTSDDDELIFWDNYKINPTTGTLLLFPVSWCFPYKEIIANNSQKMVIYGYI